MALQMLLNDSTDITSAIKWPTLAKTEVLTKEVDRLEFEITKTPSKTDIPDINDAITLKEDGTKIFGGVVTDRNEVIRGGLLVGYEYKCKDWSQYLDRVLVVKNYTGQRADQIFRDMVDNFTVGGFTYANVPASGTPVLDSISFNYEQVTRCMTQICDQIGYDWYVDYDQDIHLFSEEDLTAPFSLTDSNDTFEWNSLELSKTILQLKNAIYVRGGEYKKTIAAGNSVDVYVAGAGQKTFFLAYKYDNITVEVDGVTQTLGTDQQTDPGTVDALYNFNSRFVTFSTAMTGGEVIKVYGDAYIPIIALVRDNTSIATYGQYQAAVVDTSIKSIGEAQSRAKAELKKYNETVYEGSFKTTRTGLRTGQRITINSATRGVNKTYKINRIVGKARTPTSMEYTVYLIASGDVTFTDIMVQLLSQDKKNITIATNEVLQRLEAFIEAIALGETVTVTGTTGPYKWGPFAGDFDWNFGTWG